MVKCTMTSRLAMTRLASEIPMLAIVLTGCFCAMPRAVLTHACARSKKLLPPPPPPPPVEKALSERGDHAHGLAVCGALCSNWRDCPQT
jgi:hypothetical protein